MHSSSRILQMDEELLDNFTKVIKLLSVGDGI